MLARTNFEKTITRVLLVITLGITFLILDGRGDLCRSLLEMVIHK
jgi:hypothetical protein